MYETIKVGVFDDMQRATHAIDDALAAGIQKQAITMVVSENQPDNPADETHAQFVVHPYSDTERGHFGGALGAAIGAFLGAFSMFLLSQASHALTFGIVIGVVAGALFGSVIAFWLPWLVRNVLKLSPKTFVGGIGWAYDNRRSCIAGSIGGAIGAMAGTIASYLLGIHTFWFFVSGGIFCAATSLIVGGLVGAMSGRGLAPRALGQIEDLTDGEFKVLVSIDCGKNSERFGLIEELLRRDGAVIVRTA